MDEINEELIQIEMQKPIGGALTALEWFLLFTFIDHALQKDDMFASDQDRGSLGITVKRLHDQIFPPKKDESEAFAEKLAVKPKKLITKPDLIV